MRAGFGKAEITPPLGVELAGYGYYLHRTADRVLDPLFVRAAAFERDGERYLLISLMVLQQKISLQQAKIHLQTLRCLMHLSEYMKETSSAMTVRRYFLIHRP